MKDRVRLALVGCGWISESHVQGCQDLFRRGCREFEVTACCDLIEAKAAKRADDIAPAQGSRPQVFTDIEALIRARVADAADVCVPHGFHHSTAVPLIEGGLHVMIEKPMGITIKAGQRILDAAAKHKRLVATAENIRRMPGSRAAARAVRSGQIGQPLAGHAYVVAHGLTDYSEPKFKWRGVKVLIGGGMAIDTGAHFTDMMLHLFGEPDEVSCMMRTYDRRLIQDAPLVGTVPADVEDEFHAVIHFRNGFLLTWTYSRAFHGEGRRFGSYFGTEGTLEDRGFPFKPFDRAAELFRADGQKMTLAEMQAAHRQSLSEEEKQQLFPYDCSDAFAIEIWDFVNAVATDRAPDIDGLAGQRAKALSLACYESATLGRSVRFADVLSGKVCEYQKPIDEFWRLS